MTAHTEVTKHTCSISSLQTHDIEVDADGSQRVVGKTPGVKQYAPLQLALQTSYMSHKNA